MRNAKWLWLLAVAVASAAIAGTPAFATTYNLTFGAPYAAGSFITPSTAEQYVGAGSWYEQYPSTKTEIYVDPAIQFGTSFTIDDILSVKYHTVNNGTNPSGVDFYMLIYTPLEGADNDGSFYNKRLNSEPYLTNGYVPPSAGVWNEWDTDAGANQLTFYDANNCGNFGFYGAPTLADLQAGAINWSTWPGNPTQGSSDPSPKDYGSKTVKYLNWSTASGWASFAGYIDAIEVNLTNGDTYLINLEAKTDPVYVDDDWAGSAPGVEVEPGKFYGWNAFATIADGVANVSGSTVYVAAGTYALASTVNLNLPNLTLQGAGAGQTIVQVASSVGHAFNISATGVTLRDIELQKTDVAGAPHNLIYIGASNASILNNLIYGPDPGTPWSVNGIVSRAMVGTGGLTGLLIDNNTIHHLRQPGYFSGPTTGVISNNAVWGTRGWVNEGANLTFTNNNWPCPGNQGADIALLATLGANGPIWYPDLFALSVGNDDAYISGQFAGAKSGRAYTYVDITAVPDGNGHICHPYLSAATGAANTLPTGTCYVAAGVYEGQVEVKENITVQGSGAGVTFIKSPLSLALSFVTAGPNNNFPIIYVHDADATVRDLTVDGAGRGNANYRFIGVGYRNAGGTLENCDIIDIRNNPIDGSQHGVGIYAFADNGTNRLLNVLNNSVSGFQKNGSTFVGANLTANIDGNTITGAGAVNFIAQNGIQVSSGAGGSVTNNTVSGFAYTPFTFSSAGLLIFGATSPLTASGNTVNEAMVGIWYINTDGSITENSLTNTAGGMGATPYWWQIVADPGVGTSRQPKAQPIDEDIPVASAAPASSRLAASAMLLTTSVTRNVVDGGGNGTGIEGDALGTETLNLTVEENAVSNCLASFVLYDDPGATLNADLYNNSSVGSTIGVENQTGIMQDASGNWWGSNDPTTVASLMSGGNIDYSPWLHGGADTDLGTTGFQGDFSALWADDDSPVSGADHHIQEAVNMVSGSTVYLAPGTFVGQTLISAFADLEIIGSGVGITTVTPPATTMPYNFFTGSNNYAVFAIVNSDDVSISDLTVDGLGLGNINNRFVGIGFFESGGSAEDCEIKDIRHTPINGVQGGNAIYGYNFALPARTVSVSGCHAHGFQKGGIVMNGTYLTAEVVGNDIDGYGPANFIAMNGIQLGFGATGNVEDNEIYGCAYTPASTVSCGILLFNAAPIAGSIQVKGNSIDECEVGAYYINVAGNADSNTLSVTAAGSGLTDYYGLIIDPGKERRITPVPSEETAVASSAGTMAAGVNTISSSASWNVLDGDGTGVGLEVDAYSVANGGDGDLSFTGHANTITEFGTGVVLWEDAGATLTSVLTNNRIYYNSLGLYNENGSVDAQSNSICYNTVSADDNTAGNFYDQNSWSDWNGVAPYNVGGAGANVDNNPATGCGIGVTPTSIAYDCDGEFSFDVTIGENVSGVALADFTFAFPPSLSVTSVTTALPGWLVLTSGGAGTLNVTAYTPGAPLDGPAVLFTVTMSGSESCLDADIDMTYSQLYEFTDRTGPIPSSSAPSIHLTSDCVDPSGVTVNSPAPGACYGPAPVLDITATDDCDLDGVYYQIDGCGGTWLPIATGLSGTVYNNAAWELPGYAGLSDGVHCVYFQVVDDFARTNADACTFSWCFTKDLTGPVISCPANFSVNCVEEIAACNPNDASAVDACGGTVTITCSDAPYVGNGCSGSITRTFVATDQFGNTSSCNQVITIIDNTAPSISCLPDITVQRFLDLPPCDIMDVTVSDNCGGVVTVTCERTNVGGVGCTDDPIPVTYTYTAVDQCGNVAQCSRVITVVRPDCPFFVSAGNGTEAIDAFPGQQLTLPINADEMSAEIGAFDLAVRYDKSAVTVIGVDRGEAVNAWEYFTYRLESSETDGAGVIRLIGIADLNNGVQPSYEAFMPIGVLANVRMSVSSNPALVGRSISLEPCLNGCTDNTVVTRDGAKTIAMEEANFSACEANLSGLVVPGVRFASTRLEVTEPVSTVGDINLNGVGYEVGDVVVLSNYFVNGVSALSNDPTLRELQRSASDANNDGVLLTVADLRFLLRVVSGLASPISGAKLAPFANMGQTHYRVENGQLSVSTDANVDLGGAHFIFRYNGLSVGAPSLSETASQMTIRANGENGEFRVLVSTTADQMAAVTSGRRELFTAPVTGDGTLELVEVQMSDDAGSLMLTSVYKSVLPTEYALAQNYPNPFNAGTVIPFALKDASDWTVTIYNIVGQTVRSFAGSNEAGEIRVNWDGSDENGSSVSSGVYFYRVQAGAWTATKKMTLIK